MANIVLGIGTSHSPLLTLKADMWLERASDDFRNQALTLSDGRTLSYDALLAERGPGYADKAAATHLEKQAIRSQIALDRLEAAILEAKLDVVLVIGDDQEEMYKAGNMPALAVFCGDRVVMRPLGEIVKDAPTWMMTALSGYAMDAGHQFAGAPRFARILIDALMDEGVDLAVASDIVDPRVAAFGHAYGFIAHRLLRGQVPIVPILLNTYYPPNVIRPRRCFDIGVALAQSIQRMPEATRVGVIASGGLSHFVTDEMLDRQVLDALRAKDIEILADLPMAALRAGSSEILCWVMAGGALHDLQCTWTDYIPVYRTAAGTGIGLGFGIWS